MTIYTLFLYIGIVALGLTLVLGVGHAKLKKFARMQPILWFLQYFVGSLLIFSGLVKVVDPLGTAYKMADYFTLLLPVLSFMKPYALPFALVMIVLEVVLGINLILGHGKRWTTGLTFLMMLFFTFLTGYNYMTGFLPDGVGLLQFGEWSAFAETNIKVTDCGCFGDFLKLLPIETFFKDILLTGISVFLLMKTNDLKYIISSDAKIGGSKETSKGGIKIRLISTAIFTIATTVVCFMNFYFGLPWVDFRPFAEGKNIVVAREICDLDLAVVVRTNTYVNKNTKESVTINSQDIVTQWDKYKYTNDKDSDGKKIWIIDSTKMVEEKIHKGCEAKIKEMDGSKQHVFATNDFTFLVVADDLSHSSKDGFKKIGEIAKAAKADGFETHGMYYHIHDESKLKTFISDNMGVDVDFTQSDEKLVKTIIRSSPGLLLLHNGTIVKKWHHRNVPPYDVIRMTYMLEKEPDVVLDLQITEYSPEAYYHVFKCNVLKVEKGEFTSSSLNLNIMDGNDVLLNKLLSDTTETGATIAPIKVSLSVNEGLVPPRRELPSSEIERMKAMKIIIDTKGSPRSIEKVIKQMTFVPNGILDLEAKKAWEIVEIKK